MDTKILKYIAIVALIIIILFQGKLIINEKKSGDYVIAKEQTNELEENEPVQTVEEVITDDTEEKYVINNTLEEILGKLEKADNWDKVGTVDGQEIYTLKCPDLTTKPLLFSNVMVPVLYDDYVCVKYNPERDGEDYIMLVYYFSSDNMWEGWYKYFIAKNIKEANEIATEEINRGYAVWTDENIVLEGEVFSETTISREEFLASFLNQFDNVIYLNDK